MELPIKNPTTSQVYSYLNTVKQIDKVAIEKLINNKNLYEDEKGNCVFVGYDYDNKAKFGIIKGTDTNQDFQRYLKGSSNETGLFIKSNKSNTLIVCETIINGMSLMSIMKAKGKNLDDYSYLFLNGTNKSDQTLIYHILHNSNIENVVTAFDNDAAGRWATNNIKNKFNVINSNINIIEFHSKYENFNIDLIKSNKLKEMRDRNGQNRGIQRNDAGTLPGHERVGEYRNEAGTTMPTNGEIRKSDIELSKGNRRETLSGSTDKREPIRESSKEGRTSRDKVQDNNRATGEPGASGENTGLYEESTSTSEDSHGSGQHSDERDSSTIHVENKINYSAAINVDYNYGGAKTKFQNNVNAINLLKIIEKENRKATSEEQLILAKYTGWGGISQVFDIYNSSWSKEYLQLKEILTDDEYEMARASTPNAHYTDPVVINAMYDGLKHLGFDGGKILEPSMGIGNFYAYMPEEFKKSKLYGVELDSISGRIAKQLFQDANIEIKGFEKTEFQDNYFDVAIGNIPFGNYEIFDNKYKNNKFLIHDYFFAKTLDKVKPNGIIAFVTSKGTLDKANPTVRKYLAERAELLGAIRLPNTAFKNIANTEVTTDIIFLQKRERPIVNEPSWIHLGLTGDKVPVNQYFLDNPDMLLGKMVFDSSMYGNEKLTTLINTDKTFDIKEALNKAVSKIELAKVDTIKSIQVNEFEKEIPADPNVKNFTYTIYDDEVYYRENNIMVKCELPEQKLNKIKQLHQIRNALREVINIQTQGNYTNEDLLKSQLELNRLYDDFVSKYGYINIKNNESIFNKDIDNPLLLSIEEKKGDNEYVKADIFSKATIKPREDFKIETAENALIVSLNKYGKVNIPFMAEVYNKSPEEVIKELKNKIFLNPALYDAGDPYKGYETAEEYLSGDVKAKLAYAKLIDNEKFSANIDALIKVQPEDLKIYDIGYKLGSNWIPLKMYHDFMYETLQTPRYSTIENNKDSIRIVYNEFSTAYTIYNKNDDNRNVLVTSKYGTERRNAYQLIEDTLNFKAANVYDTTSDDKKVLNAKETQLARAKQELLKNEFVNWVLKKEERIQILEKIYNEKFNVYIPRKYNGDELIVPAMNNSMELRKHQKDTAMRILLGGNTLIAHEVGAGKTFTMATGAMLLKQAGIAKKPLFVVPNHLIKQWGSEFLTLFPTANILVPNEKDFEIKNRQKFISKIATGNYDAVILSFSQFEKIPMSSEYVQNQLKKEIAEITTAIDEIRQTRTDKMMSVKQYEMQKKSLEATLSKMTDTTKKDKVLTFEELGVDYLFVDEAHYYKNCYVHTKMNNVAGVSTTNSQKSFDMLLKTRYLNERNNGRGVIFATGTPITNSISETYVMQRYLQEDTLKKAGIHHFDQWASTFGEITSSLELSPTGNGFRMKTRFSKFYNMPELLKMFNQIADMKSVDDLNIKRPDIVGDRAKTIVVNPSEFVKEKMRELEARADDIKDGKVDATIDNMLKITMEGKAVAIDPSLVEPNIVNTKDSKIYACCNKVIEMYNKTKPDKALQLVFLDYGVELYKTMKEELIENGVAEKEIAFISDAKNDKQKQALFEKCRSGEVRVLFGSTLKMGAGTNVQDRMIALHHVDCPWRPADIEQRNGRIRRQGNMYDKVHIFQYVTKGTFDSYLWQIQEKKQTFISQIMKNDIYARCSEDLDKATLECSEVKALCCGDPRIKEKADIDNDIQRLQLEKNAYLREQEKFKDLINTLPGKIESYLHSIDNLKEDLQKLRNNDKFEIKIGEKIYTEKADAAEALNTYIKTASYGDDLSIGNYKGLDMLVYKMFIGTTDLCFSGKHNLHMELGESPIGNIARITNIEDKYINSIGAFVESKNSLEKQLVNVREEYGRPFIKETELTQKLQKQAQLTIELELNKTSNVIIEDKMQQDKINKSQIPKENDMVKSFNKSLNKKREIER